MLDGDGLAELSIPAGRLWRTAHAEVATPYQETGTISRVRASPDPVDNVISLALKKLSDEDLDLLCNVAYDQAKEVDRALTERESAAVAAYNAALASEMSHLQQRP